jgi:hypothetical protein
VSTADTYVTWSVNSVRRDKIGQQIPRRLVLSSWRYWLTICARIGWQFSEGNHYARPIKRRLSISKILCSWDRLYPLYLKNVCLDRSY